MLSFYLNLIENEDDRRKFEEIYYTYRQQMFLVARNFLNCDEDAEDVVHDVFVTIATKHMPIIKKINSDRDLKNYLLKSAKNRALDFNKKNKRQKNYLYKTVESDRNEIISDEYMFDTICDNMNYQDIISAIQQLNQKYKEVLYYHFVIELTVAETAKILDRNLFTVKKQLLRGKKQLLDILNIKENETDVNK